MTIEDLIDYLKLTNELVKLVPQLLSWAAYCRTRWNAVTIEHSAQWRKKDAHRLSGD